MNLNALKQEIDGIDIYLLDQILKERFAEKVTILDAGCGYGRNLKWFYTNNYKLYGVDADPEKITVIKQNYPKLSSCFSAQKLDELAFSNDFFDHIICNAVLHFAKSKLHFINMLSELVRVLKPNGSLFIRMTSSFGIESYLIPTAIPHIYNLPDNSERFLLNSELLNEIITKFELTCLEPIKTVNVENLRCMTTLVFRLGG